MYKRLVRNAMVWLAAAGFCMPDLVLAVEPTPQPAVADVALANGGTLHGQVLDPQGGGVAGVPVSLRTQDRNVTTTTTAADGRFAVPNLRGGVYQVAAAKGRGNYRLWTVGTAPPSAQNGAIIYTGNGNGGSKLKMFLANPIVIAGIVATAIAVPVALNNSHHASP